MIELAYDENYALKVTSFGMEVLKGKASIHFAQPEVAFRPAGRRKRAEQRPPAPPKPRSMAEELLDELKNLRKMIADSEGIPPVVVFNDSTLMGMVLARPQDNDEMLEISGVSQNKLEKYGREFLSVISR